MPAGIFQERHGFGPLQEELGQGPGIGRNVVDPGIRHRLQVLEPADFVIVGFQFPAVPIFAGQVGTAGNSIVECDYGGLAIYLENSLVENGQPGLNADTSIEDVARSLAGLAAGDGALAGQGYERLVTRWRRVAAFEQAM